MASTGWLWLREGTGCAVFRVTWWRRWLCLIFLEAPNEKGLKW